MRTFDSTTEQNILRVVQEEVVPALGCTEPISLALASATARYYLGKMPERIEAKVSPNLMKNGMGVTVPNTGTVGLPMAAAIGAIGGAPSRLRGVEKHFCRASGTSQTDDEPTFGKCGDFRYRAYFVFGSDPVCGR